MSRPNMGPMATMLSGIVKAMAIARSLPWTFNAAFSCLSASSRSSLIRVYPADSTALRMSSSDAAVPSYVTVAVLFPKLAFTDSTPGTFPMAFSILPEQAAQDMPPILKTRVLMRRSRASRKP